MVGFIFGGNSGTTYNDLQRRREIRDALAKKVLGGQPKNTAEGVGSILSGLAVGIGRNRDAKVENEGTSKASSFAEAILSGGSLGGSPSTASQVSATSPAPAGPVRQMAAVSPSNDPVQSVLDAASGPSNSGFIRYANQGATRSEPLNDKLVNALGFLPDLGVQMEVFSGGQDGKGEGGPRTGSTRHDHGNAADVFFTKDGRRLNWADEKDRPIFEEIVRRGKQAGVTGFGAGDGYMQPGSMHLGFGSPAVWGAGGKGSNAPDWLRQAYNSPANQQVASLDPSAGMGQPQNAAQAIEAQAPQQMPPMQPPQTVGPAPAVAGQPMEVAGGGGRPGMFDQPQQAPQQQQAGGVDPRILQALSNPFTPPEMKQSLQILAQQQQQQAQMQQEQQTWMQRQQYSQQQQQADPGYQADLEYKRAQTDRMKQGNRPITPEEREQWGIPQEDSRPYAMTPDGPELVGSGGQTINFRTEIDARRQIASEMGIDPASEEGKRYILTGNLPSGDKGVTAGDREAIRDSDDMVNSGEATLGLIDRAMDLSGQAYEGAGAGARALVASQWGDEGALATREYDNIITEQALGQLKSIFGGAPTEGERAILLDIQGSSSQPKSVRDAILQRARKAVERRVNYNRDRASELRGGTYYKPRDTAAPANAAPAGQPQPAGRLRFNPQTGELE